MTWGKKSPSKLILDPGHGLDKTQLKLLDRKLMTAWQILKDETCQRCGTPFWIGHSDNSWLEFQMAETECYCCAAVGEDEDERAKDKNKKHGVTRYPYPQMTEVDGVETPPMPRREEYYKALEAERRRSQGDK